MEMLEIKSVTYLDILQLVPSFISLDISVNSTGWVKYLDGQVTQGTYSITTSKSDAVGRRREFRKFVKDLFGEDEFEYLFIEDVIGSINFETAKILYQLNPLADDMRDDGIIHAKHLIREDNQVWKKHLKLAANYVATVRSEKDDKQMVRDALFLMGFGDKTTDTIAEDIYDAMGMSVGVIYRTHVLKQEGSGKKLRKDISKTFKIAQFDDEYAALDFANDLNRPIHQANFLNIKRDLKFNFKKLVEELDDDRQIFVISIPTSKMGALALNKGLDLDIEVSHLVVYLK